MMRRLALAALLLLGGCASPEARVPNWAGGLVEQPGLYVDPRTGLHLRVKTAGGLVNYTVQDSTGRELFHNRERASAHQRWALYAAPDGSLWVASSDVGTIVWRRNSEGAYYQRDATGEEPDRPAVLAPFYR
ncbi:hypothetical protein LJ737_01485 [Hymenobacter sp. 15J16-1T3B]|uniref:hypothetical protein n=1 Tax=Hymenobacter sp. 15J16-1T3B TaxID=2886941 RepID=UPI001D12CE2A|nr:hypothetical protein [Hymenobacter sp. 15J16-1T3B]MCC3155890.1 hypothetical protein [Hymenobacter sp. 15J16-1T3B]